MSTLINKVLGRAPERLPDDLTSLTERQIENALDGREARIRRLAEQGKGARGEERMEVLTEIRTAADDVKRLRAATGTGRREATTGGSEEAAWTARTSGRHAGPGEEPANERAVKMVIARYVVPRELTGIRLDPARLTEEDGTELLKLLSRRAGSSFPVWDETAQERMEALVEQAAGAPVFTDLQTERELLAFAEEVRRSTLPVRPPALEPGAISLPAAIFDDLREGRTRGARRGSTAGDIATLAIVLNAFALRDATLIQGGRFEGDALVVKGRELRLVIGTNPPFNTLDGAPVRPDLDGLAGAGWLDVTRRGGRIEIRKGERARALD